MQVLVDTSVWSLALRRPPVPDHAIHPAAKALKDLIANGSAAMLGAIRQELLSGIKTASQFAKLQAALRAFDDLELQQSDYETAALVPGFPL